MIRKFAAAAALLVALLLTGCTAGDGSEEVQTEPGPPPPAGATGEPVIGVTTLPPVPVGEDTAVGGGLVASVRSIDDAQVAAVGPGEIAGPGVAVTVALTNESDAPIDLDGVTVNAYFGDGIPATGNSAEPAAPVSGDLPPAESREGVYLFQIPEEETPSVVVEINYVGSPNVVLITR